MKRLLALGFALALAVLSQPAAATEDKAYDLLFRNGTLDSVDRQMALVYSREVTNTLKPEAANRDTGDIALSVDAGDAKLSFRQDGKHRPLGKFPASVGNPMIMYFYETVVRDMAETAGGSPFYIRNRVKEALTKPWDVEKSEALVDGETIPVLVVKMRPFEEDPNRDRMRGFGDLEMSILMSEEVPGWYLNLTAETVPSSGSEIVYRSALAFERLEPVK
ncbi:MAG: hypothetical protein AAFY03_11560 [Pseudomonadota bacterium]